MDSDREIRFAAPTWLRDLGFTSWLLTGFVLIIIGVIWLLGQTATIVMPVIVAGVLSAVTGPLVTWMEGHRVPRGVGAILVLLGLVAIGVLIFSLVTSGITANSSDISAKLNSALDSIEGWFKDVGVDGTEEAKAGVKDAMPEITSTLLGGAARGLEGLGSLLFFLAFTTLSTLFMLKDGPVMVRFVNRHMGVPVPVAEIVTTDVANSLRSYFLGVTIVAAFNAIVIGVAAVIIGVPLAGSIAVVTFVCAYVPYLGAWTAGAFTILVALGTEGADAALALGVVTLLANSVLQQLMQPFVMGAALDLNPLVVLIVTIGGGSLFGMAGLTLAAPLTSAAVHIAADLRARSPA